jgi:hypothetical protein
MIRKVGTGFPKRSRYGVRDRPIPEITRSAEAASGLIDIRSNMAARRKKDQPHQPRG